MLTLASLLAWLIAAAPLLALTVYSVEVLVGLKAGAPDARPHVPQGQVAMLIPAHNEAGGIAETVIKMKAVLPEGSRLLVVADNCADDTAALARAAGAEVVERHDEERRGKGYALSYGCSILAADPPATVIVVDADANMSPGGIEHLCRVADAGSPAQATYLMTADLPAPALVQISNFAFLVKNLVRVRALGRTGRCALLTGSGMAFPWAVFANAPLASGNITEDLGLGIALTRAGHPARHAEHAVVLSPAAAVDASVSQRQRWEHGFLTNALQYALPTLGDGIRKGSRSMIALGLHLLVPPLALLMIVSVAVLAVLAVIGLVTTVWAPAAALAAALAVAVTLTIIVWARMGRQMLTLRALVQIPLYVLWKLPLYARFLFKRETQWQRTKREGEG